jgi:hypothetical protein
MRDTQFYYLLSLEEVQRRAREICGAATLPEERRRECRPVEGRRVGLALCKRWLVPVIHTILVRMTGTSAGEPPMNHSP